jgi:hypothetical protein
MAVRILDWPSAIPPAMVTIWYLRVSTQSPGPGLDGRRQVIFRESRIWTNNLTLTQLWGARAAALQVLLDDLRGSYGLVRIPVRNSFTTIYPGTLAAFYAQFGLSADIIANGIPFSTGVRFSSGVGFALPDFADPSVAADAPIGATILQLVGFLGQNLAIGGFFSCNGFLYRVAENDDGLVRFNPPLRQAIPAGTVVQVSAPDIVVRLAQDMQARLQLTQRRIGTVAAFDVEEAFER